MITVQEEPFDPGLLLSAFVDGNPKAGAVVSFSGIVRDNAGGDSNGTAIEMMEIEHYPGMTEKALRSHADVAVGRWQLGGVMIIHRFGKLPPGAVIMMVATAAAHRRAAFDAADFLMDYLKSRAPFWKKEVRGGIAEWVGAKPEDEAALDRWS